MVGIHIGQGIASIAAAAWTRQLSTLLLYVVAGRVLTPAQIGVFALSAAIVLLFEYAIFDPLSQVIVQRQMIESSHVGSVLMLSGCLGAFVAGLGLLTGDWIAGLFSMPELAGSLRVMFVGVGIICLSSAHAGILRREQRFHAIALLAAFASVAAAALGAVLLLAGFGLRALTTYFLCEKVVLCLGTIVLARTQPLGRISTAHARDLLPYAAAICGQRMASYARGQMDRVIIGILWGAATLGAYQIAARIFDSLHAALLGPPSKLFFVSYAKLQQHPEQLRDMFTRSLQAVALISLPAFLGISVVAPEAISVLFGEQWGLSGIILQVLGFGGVALTLSIMSGAVLSAVGHVRSFLFVEVFSTLIGLALLVAFSRFGIGWMAATFVLREGIAVAIYARFLPKLLDLSPRGYLGCFLPCLLSACGMWLVVASLDFGLLTEMSEQARLFAQILAGATVYALLMFVFGRPLLTDAIALVTDRHKVTAA